MSAPDQPDSSVPGRLGTGVLAPVRRASGTIIKACDRTAYWGWSAAAVTVLSLGSLTWPLTTTGWVALSLLAAVLAMPGLVVYLLARAVGGVTRLPTTLFEQATSTPAPPLNLRGGPLKSVWRLGRYLMEVRGRLWAMRDELAAAGAVLRLGSPPVLLSVLGAVVAIGALTPVAGILLLLALIF